MKKIATAVAAMAMAATMFAVDFSATVKVDGDIASGDIKTFDAPSEENGWAGAGYDAVVTTNVLKFGYTDQKDADLLEVHFAGDKAGADFKFYVNSKADTGVSVRALDVWFCPVDPVKVTVGNITSGLYKEQLDWWKVPTGSAIKLFNSWASRWQSYSTVEGYGALVDVNLDVLGGLSLEAGVTADDGLFTKTGSADAVFGAYGVQAKLNVADGVSVGVAWRDAGTKKDKILAVGGDYAAGDFYGMVQARMYFDCNNVAGYGANYDKVALSGIAIDNYFKYNFGFMNIDAALPVVIRGIRSDLSDADKEIDPTYMTARVRVQIPMDSMVLKCIIGSNGNDKGQSSAWTLNDTFGDTFNMTIYPSVDFNVGICQLNVGAEFLFQNNKKAAWSGDDKVYTNMQWYVPFTAKVAF